MKVSYLNSMSTGHSYAAKDLFAASISVPELTPEQLPQVLEGAEHLFLGSNRAKLQIRGETVPLQDIARNSADREGAAMLYHIAATLPRAYSRRAPNTATEEAAYFGVAALIASPAFWDTAETALQQTLNRDTVLGDIRLESPAQVGMNVTISKDGESIECHLSAAWKEYRADQKWHRLRVDGAVLTANVKVVIPLKRVGSEHRLEASFVSLHVNSPLPEIRDKLLKHKSGGLGAALLDALSRIPLLGRLFRGVQIKVQVGMEFGSHRMACVPNELGDWSWLGTAHQPHVENPETSCQHIVFKKLAHRPNWIRCIHAGAAGNVPSLKTLLDNRNADLRARAAILDAMPPQAPLQHNPHPQPDVPMPPDNIPPLPEPELQFEALRRALEAERVLRQEGEAEREALRAERDKLHADTANLQQHMMGIGSERDGLRAQLDEMAGGYHKAKSQILELQENVAKLNARLASQAMAEPQVVNRVVQEQMNKDRVESRKQNSVLTGRPRGGTFSGPNGPASTTVANNAEPDDKPASAAGGNS